MKYKIGSFIWKNGSINDNIRTVLKNNGIEYYNTVNGDIYTAGDNRKVIAEGDGIDKEYTVK